MTRNTNSGYGDSTAGGNTVPAWLRYDPLYREIYQQRPHQVTA